MIPKRLFHNQHCGHDPHARPLFERQAYSAVRRRAHFVLRHPSFVEAT